MYVCEVSCFESFRGFELESEPALSDLFEIALTDVKSGIKIII